MTVGKIRSHCPHCSRAVVGTDKHVGRELRCPGCGELFVFQQDALTPTSNSEEEGSASTVHTCPGCREPLTGSWCKTCKQFTFMKTVSKWSVPFVVIPLLLILGSTQPWRLLMDATVPWLNEVFESPSEGYEISQVVLYAVAGLSAVSWVWIYFGLPATSRLFSSISRTSGQQATTPVPESLDQVQLALKLILIFWFVHGSLNILGSVGYFIWLYKSALTMGDGELLIHVVIGLPLPVLAIPFTFGPWDFFFNKERKKSVRLTAIFSIVIGGLALCIYIALLVAFFLTNDPWRWKLFAVTLLLLPWPFLLLWSGRVAHRISRRWS